MSTSLADSSGRRNTYYKLSMWSDDHKKVNPSHVFCEKTVMDFHDGFFVFRYARSPEL